ncbi:MAG TPA: glycosyltransferase WbuB [Candidatus Marinimicrobia bacterium]|nr:glycosyltransferase WbuB [Candidatus Neomarinimicrobiota bacterium]
MMNICMVAYTFYEFDNRVRRYAETLISEGHDVDMVALRYGDQPKIEVIEGVTVHRIQPRTLNEKTRWSYLWRLLTFLFRSFLLLSWKYFTKRYKLIHVHSVPDFEVFAALIPRLLGCPVILDIHDIVPEFYASKFNTSKESMFYKALIFVERISIGFSNQVIISNHLWEKTLKTRGIPESKLTTIVNYPDPKVFKNRSISKTSENFLMIYPGTLNWHQGVDLAIKAFAKINSRFPKAQFHIYGGGPEKENLERLVVELGLKKKVIFKGMVPREQAAEVMAKSDLGIVPKRSDSFGNEAFSTKTLEFMALGVPVLISETAVDRYYFNDDIAIFFQAGDVDDLAAKIGHLISDQALRQKLAKNAIVFAEKNNWGVKSPIYLDLVERLTS